MAGGLLRRALGVQGDEAFEDDFIQLFAFVILRRSEAETGGPSGAEGDLFSRDVGRGGVRDRLPIMTLILRRF